MGAAGIATADDTRTKDTTCSRVRLDSGTLFVPYRTPVPVEAGAAPGGRYNPMDEIYFHAVSGVLFVKGPDGQSAQLPAWSVHAV